MKKDLKWLLIYVVAWAGATGAGHFFDKEPFGLLYFITMIPSALLISALARFYVYNSD